MDNQFSKRIVEALIFASDIPVAESKLSSYVDGLTNKRVRGFVKELNDDYSKSKRAFFIAAVAGGYQITTRQEFAPWIKKMFKGRAKQRLSQPALESLAIIAFKQPISRVEIDAIRGVHSGGVLKNLLERNLVAIAGRSDGAGRPLIYSTTAEFLRYFGINAISELPKPKEIEEIMGKLDGSEEVSDRIMSALTELGSVEENGHDEAE